QETLPGPVPVPGRHAFEHLPLAIACGWTAQHGQQSVIELCQLLVDGLLWPTDQMRRDAFLAPLELSLVEEAQARGQEGDDSRGFMYAWGEGRRGPGLIVVFEKACQLV